MNAISNESSSSRAHDEAGAPATSPPQRQPLFHCTKVTRDHSRDIRHFTGDRARTLKISGQQGVDPLCEALVTVRNTPPAKLADVELHFDGGELDGLKLIGFAVWRRRDGNGQKVTLPARTFDRQGDRRSFALLRSIHDPSAQDRIRELILRAYEEDEERTAIASNS